MTRKVDETVLHPLAKEFELSTSDILNVIAGARRLRMTVRGWVEEEHQRAKLDETPGVTDCARVDTEGCPDIRLRFQGGLPLGALGPHSKFPGKPASNVIVNNHWATNPASVFEAASAAPR
jgi:hypothetical protein